MLTYFLILDAVIVGLETTTIKICKMEYLFIYKCLYVAIIYVHFVEVNIAIVEINYGHQKIGFYNNEGNLSKDQY